MVTKRVVAAIVVCLGASLSAAGAQASLVGDSVQIQEFFPDLSTPDGIPDGPLTISSLGTDFGVVGESRVDVTVSGSTISLSGNEDTLSATFNGFAIEDLNKATTITGVSLDSASGPLPAGDLTFDAHDVFVNVEGLALTSPPAIIVDVTSSASATPEPATWAIMLAGFGGMGVVLRRSRRLGSARA